MAKESIKELAHKIKTLKTGLELGSDENIFKTLVQTKKMDDLAIENIIRNEGAMQAQEDFIYQIENEFLKEQTIYQIRRFQKKPSTEWTFLSDIQKRILNTNKDILKRTMIKYRLSRAELMILRKAVIDFVTKRLKRLELKSTETKYTPEKAKELINIIINNYTYIDTLRNLGFYKDPEDEFSMYKYVLDDNFRYREQER